VISIALALFTALAGADWSPNAFDYNRPPRLKVQEVEKSGGIKVARATQQHLVFRNVAGQEVPALLTLPRGRAPFPVVVLVHGYASSGEHITHYLAPELVGRGFATLAIDLPMHGERPGPPKSLFAEGDPKKTHRQLAQAVIDLRQAIDLAESRKELDTSGGVFLVGYSMGSWLATLTSAADRRVSALVLMSPVSEAVPADARGRRQERSPQKPLLERFPDLRPTEAIARFAPRPVLIQAGNLDLYLPKEPVDALFAAAREPKELRWYDSSHILPPLAVEEATNWLLQQRGRQAGKSSRGSGQAQRDGQPARR